MPYEDNDKAKSGSLWFNNQGKRNQSSQKHKSEQNIEIGGSAIKKLNTMGSFKNAKGHMEKSLSMVNSSLQVDIRDKKAVVRSSTVKVNSTAESRERSISNEEIQQKKSRQVYSNSKKIGTTKG